MSAASLEDGRVPHFTEGYDFAPIDVFTGCPEGDSVGYNHDPPIMKLTRNRRMKASLPRKRPEFRAIWRDSHPEVIVVGASAGGIETFGTLVRQLPEDLRAAIVLVIHISPFSPSALPQVFDRMTKLKVPHNLKDGEIIKPGHVYVAPPDYHLLVEPGRLRLVRGPTENRHRPAIDPLFRSAARAYGNRAVGVVLSGTLDDGAAGLWSIKQCGGTTIVQEPEDALYSGMPRSALDNVKPDYVLPVAEMAALLINLTDEKRPSKKGCRNSRTSIETDVAEMRRPMDQMEGLGKPSTLTCPQCQGALWELREGKLFRYRCRVGHAFTAETLEQAQTEQLEHALWSAVRALEEKASLLGKLGETAHQRKHDLAARQFEVRARELEPAVKVLREMLIKHKY